MLENDVVLDSVKDVAEKKVLLDKKNYHDTEDIYYEIALENYIEGAKVWVLKNQTIAQSLSVLVETDDHKIFVFDGGRKEDAKYLYSFIVNHGRVVDGWFLTHIHDDHVGALYEILNSDFYGGEYSSIFIEDLYYNFADFDFYYKSEGNDAGIVVLLEEKFKDYKKNMDIFLEDFIMPDDVRDYQRSMFNPFEIKNNIYKGYVADYKNIKVEVMNDLYKIDTDSVNNSSIVYKVYFENAKSMMVLGDLAYLGGEKLLEDYKDDIDKLKSDIVVMAHHGQAGVGEEVYKAISPEVAIWPTTEKIYMNTDNNYSTNDTKKWMSDIGVKYNILSYEGTQIIK